MPECLSTPPPTKTRKIEPILVCFGPASLYWLSLSCLSDRCCLLDQCIHVLCKLTSPNNEVSNLSIVASRVHHDDTTLHQRGNINLLVKCLIKATLKGVVHCPHLYPEITTLITAIEATGVQLKPATFFSWITNLNLYPISYNI